MFTQTRCRGTVYLLLCPRRYALVYDLVMQTRSPFGTDTLPSADSFHSLTTTVSARYYSNDISIWCYTLCSPPQFVVYNYLSIHPAQSHQLCTYTDPWSHLHCYAFPIQESLFESLKLRTQTIYFDSEKGEDQWINPELSYWSEFKITSWILWKFISKNSRNYHMVWCTEQYEIK